MLASRRGGPTSRARGWSRRWEGVRASHWLARGRPGAGRGVAGQGVAGAVGTSHPSQFTRRPAGSRGRRGAARALPAQQYAEVTKLSASAGFWVPFSFGLILFSQIEV